MLRFTIDVSKKNVEPMELFFHNFEYDGENFEADPTIVQKLGIAIRDAICSVLKEKGEAEIQRMAKEVNRIIECLDNEE